jgi:nitrate reductase gamma subunit
MLDTILFGIFPYVAVALAVIVGLYRYFSDRYSFSTHSSQFLESRTLYWGSVPWHFAILIILAAHLLAFLFPAAWGTLAGRPLRLYLLEISGLALGVMTVIGVTLLLLRRARNPRVSVVSSPMDFVVLGLLLVQVATGVWIAFTLRWGSVWYLHTATPWLWSLLRFDPQVQYLAALPWIVKVHAANAFLLIALFPFSRLVHIVTVPLDYLGRSAQLVVWNRKRAGRGT